MPFGFITLNDGAKVPAIAFGSGSVWKFHDVTKYVAQAIECGFSHIDTAAFYQNEESVGQAIRESGLARNELFITTKFSMGNPLELVKTSLSKLGLKHVDLYLIHTPTLITDIPATWKAFETIKEQGLARSIGVSNFMVEHLEQVLKTGGVVPAVNQINLHPYNYSVMKPVLELSAKHNIVIEAFGSLAPVTKFPGGPVDAPIAAAALRRGASPTQIIQLWVKSKGAVIVTTSSKKEHLEEYLAVADLPPLTDEEIAAIEEAGAKGPPTFAKLYMFRLVQTFGLQKVLVLLGALIFVLFQVIMMVASHQ